MEFALGTVCAVNLYESGSNELYSRIFSRIREIDRTMTAWQNEFQDLIGGGLADSDSAAEALISGIVAINSQAGIEPARVRADLIDVLETALYYAELSGGAFDPTVGPLVKLWGIGTDMQRVPSDDEIAAALELVNWRDLAIDRNERTVFLRREGMEIDLGAIAKGYAADEAARIAREANVKRAVIDLGGNIIALGWRQQRGNALQRLFSRRVHADLPWRIGIQNPLSERGSYIGVLSARDTSVVTSGVYERFFESGGKRYHHLLSTGNGQPVENGLVSVTIVTERSIEADALSTVVFTLGFEQGKALIDSIPGAEAIFIFDDHRVHITDGLAGIFALTNDEYDVF